ncbi:hypothetical protein SDC9_20209 [bioreactor metagenome]|uniref:Uncharacterized protein n=1 Tax=bioreactor metagenome TaxID=1076179 RepID=A0A644U631_9ZZZZ
MSNRTLDARIIIKNNLAATFVSNNPVLLKGEMGFENDTRKFKFGDGVTAWNDLAYASANPAVLKTTNPGISDSSYDVGVIWMNTTTKRAYVLTDNTAAAAVWKQVVFPEDLNSYEPKITGDVVTKFWSGTKTWRDLATDVRAIVLTGLSTATNAVIATGDTLLVALGKLQAQITAHGTRTDNPHSVTKAQVGLGSVDNTADSAKNVLSASKLTTARNISLTGDASASASFDGSANISLAMVLANVVTAGTGCKITVNAKGLVTGIAALSAADIPALTAAKITDLGSAATKNTGTSVGNVVVVNASGKIDDSLLPPLAITDTFEAGSQAEMLALTAQVGDICIRSDENKTYILKTAPATTLANWKELKTPTNGVISVNGQTGAITLTTSHITEGTNLYWTEARGTANFNTNFALKSVVGLSDGNKVLMDTDTLILNGGN